MPSFVASEAVEELTYDFAAVSGPVGSIPEPTGTQMQAFRTTMAELMAEMIPEGTDTKFEEMSTDQMRKLVNDAIGKDQSEMIEKVLHAIAAVCSDHPSFDELAALPYRHQQAFTGWITGVFLLPPALTTATNG